MSPNSGALIAPIGVFDSGVGGLTVLRALRRVLPAEDFVYLGDTARVPYGTKSPATVARYAVNVARALADEGCKALVIACNTASAFGIEAVRAAVDMPVIDVIDPVCDAIRDDTATARVGVLGTRGTVASGAYVEALRRGGRDIAIEQQPCPLFVPLAEEGWVDGPIPEGVADEYLAQWARDGRFDAVVLGCTHYPLLRGVIERVLRRESPTEITIHESGSHTARRVSELLARRAILRSGDAFGTVRYLVSDDPSNFISVGQRFLGEPIVDAEHVSVGAA